MARELLFASGVILILSMLMKMHFLELRLPARKSRLALSFALLPLIAWTSLFANAAGADRLPRQYATLSYLWSKQAPYLCRTSPADPRTLYYRRGRSLRKAPIRDTRRSLTQALKRHGASRASRNKAASRLRQFSAAVKECRSIIRCTKDPSQCEPLHPPPTPTSQTPTPAATQTPAATPSFTPTPDAPGFTLTIQALHGTVLVSPVKEAYCEGEEVSLLAVPDPGYRFAAWGGDAKGPEPSILIIMSEDRNVSADFAPIDGALEYHVDAEHGSDTEGNGTATLPFRSIAKVRPLLKGGDSVILYGGNYGTISEGNRGGPVEVFDTWVTFKAAPGVSPVLQNILLGANGSHFYGERNFGSFDAFLRFTGLRIADGVLIYGARHVMIENSFIERAEPWTGSEANIEKTAVGMRGGRNIVIQGNEITNTGTGLGVVGNSIRVINNHIHDITHDGIRVVGASDSLIEGNRIHGLDDGIDDSSGLDWNRHCDAIHIFIGGSSVEEALIPNDNVTFRGNVIYDVESQGVQFNNYLRFPDVRNRRIYFENNIFGPTRANAFNNADPVDTLVFRHNTFIPVPGRSFTSRFRTIPVGNTTLRITDRSSNVEVYNNILSGSPAKGANTVIADWNLVLQASTGFNTAIGRFTIIDTAPQFENPEAFDGRLLPSSKAIDAGTSLFAPRKIYPTDRLGTPRDVRPDMGAYELPGRTPSPETPPPVSTEQKTAFFDDFEDADFATDPWLDAPAVQGLAWVQPESNQSNRYWLMNNGTTLERNFLTGPQGAGSAIILSAQGGTWADYALSFDAHNSYLWIGDGPVLLALDEYNYYWVDISRDNGRLIRSMTLSDGSVRVDILATNAAIEMPHSGTRSYHIVVTHVAEGIKFEVDAGDDGMIDLNYIDSDSAAVARFPAGGVGFRRDYPQANHRMSYDNILVEVHKFRPL